MMKLSTKISLFYLSNRQFSTTFKFKQNMQNSSVDPNEVKYFNTMGSIWWEKEGLFKALHTLNNLRVPFIKDALINRGILNQKYINSSTPLKDLNILDVGCGGGILSEALALLGANVTGVDVVETLIKYAKIHAHENQNLNNEIKYIVTSIEDMVPYSKNKFDVVVSSECVEHVNCVETYLKSCIQVLKPGGSIFVTTINKTIPAWLKYIVLDEYIFKIIPKGTHRYGKFVSPRDVTKLLRNNNCEILLLRGFSHNINCSKWFWTRNTLINYAIHAVKCT